MMSIEGPFPGMRSYEPHEYPIFFGRTNEIEVIIGQLLRYRCISIVGVAGCGKTSIVRAGIIPQLIEKQQNEAWKVLDFTFTGNGLESLLMPMYKLFDVQDTRGYTPTELAELSKNIVQRKCTMNGLFSDFILESDSNYFIFFDQLEGLFCIVDQLDDAQIWIENIVDLFEQHSNVYVCLCLQSDCLSDMENLPQLASFVNRSNYLVFEIAHKELSEIICNSLDCFGLKMAENLLAQIVSDFKTLPVNLALLQHCLFQLFENYRETLPTNKTIDNTHYLQIGTLERSLQIHAECFFWNLKLVEQREILSKIIKVLSSPNPQRHTFKTFVRIRDLSLICGCTIEQVLEVVATLRTSALGILYPSTLQPLSARSYLSLSNALILTNWDRAKLWADEEVTAVELYLRLCQASALYQLGQGGLWKNPELELALNWLSAAPNIHWASRYNPAFDRAINFLTHSHRQYLYELVHKEESQKRKISLFRNFAIVIGVAFVFAVLLSIIALTLKYEAQRNEQKAVTNAKLAILARKISEQKTSEAIQHQKISHEQQQIAETQRSIAETQKVFAEQQQHIAKQQQRIAEVQRNDAQISRKLALLEKQNAENSRLQAEIERSRADSLRNLAEQQTQLSEHLRKLAIARTLAIQASKLNRTHTDSELSKILAATAYKLNLSAKGPAHEPNIFAAMSELVNSQNVYLGHSDIVRDIYVNPRGEVFTAGDDGKLLSWDLQTKSYKVQAMLSNSIHKIVVTPLGTDMFLLTQNGSIYHRNSTKELFSPVKFGNKTFASIACSSSKLWACSGDSVVYFLPTPLDKSNFGQIKMPFRVLQVFASRDGKYMAFGSDSEIYIFRENDLAHELVRIKDGQRRRSLSFSADNKYVAFSNSKNEVQLLDILNHTLRSSNIRHDATINAIAFYTKQTLLASSSYDGSLQIWNYSEGKNDEPLVISDHAAWVLGTSFSADGNSVFSVGEDRTLRQWLVNEALMLKVLDVKRDMTKEEWLKYAGQHLNMSNR